MIEKKVEPAPTAPVTEPVKPALPITSSTPTTPPAETPVPAKIETPTAASAPIKKYANNPSTSALTDTQIKNKFATAFQADDLKEMRNLVSNYPVSMIGLFNSYKDALKTLSGNQATMVRMQAEIIGRLFVTEHDDESLWEQIRQQ